MYPKKVDISFNNEGYVTLDDVPIKPDLFTRDAANIVSEWLNKVALEDLLVIPNSKVAEYQVQHKINYS